MNALNRFIYLFISIIIVISCDSSNSSTFNGDIIVDQQLRTRIESAPEIVLIGNIEVHSSAYIGRDFMPGISTTGSVSERGLMASLTLFRLDGETLPNDMRISKVYIASGSQIWVPKDWEIREGTSPNKLEIVIQSGPAWEPETMVTAAIEFQNSLTTESKIIVVKDEIIQATY